MSNPFYKYKHFCFKQFSWAYKNSLCQTIQFSISTPFTSIWLIDRSLSGTTTPGHSRPESDGNNGALLIPKSSCLTGTSSSDCLVSYPGNLLAGVLPICREAINVLCDPSRLGKKFNELINLVDFISTPYFVGATNIYFWVILSSLIWGTLVEANFIYLPDRLELLNQF